MSRRVGCLDSDKTGADSVFERAVFGGRRGGLVEGCELIGADLGWVVLLDEFGGIKRLSVNMVAVEGGIVVVDGVEVGVEKTRGVVALIVVVVIDGLAVLVGVAGGVCKKKVGMVDAIVVLSD